MKRLTFNGVNDLYQTPFGAYTLADYEEILAARKRYVDKPITAARHIVISPELAARDERCIDEYGCSAF